MLSALVGMTVILPILLLTISGPPASRSSETVLNSAIGMIRYNREPTPRLSIAPSATLKSCTKAAAVVPVLAC